jgi:VanZ family protein
MAFSPMKPHRKSSTIAWVAAILWMLAIFIMSSIPLYRLPRGPEYIPAIIHFTEFFILASLLIWALSGGFGRRLHFISVFTAFAVSVFYGVVDEFHQIFVPGRVPDAWDILLDATGAAAACLLIPLAYSFIPARASSSPAADPRADLRE